MAVAVVDTAVYARRNAVELPMITAPAPPAEHRHALVRRARTLAWLGVGWHGVEATIAIVAGLGASSIALIGFGADSILEAFAGVIVLWRFAASRVSSVNAERRAQRLIALSFYVIAAYVAVEAVRALAGGHEPEASWIGIGLAAFTAATMPPLAMAKTRVAARLGSSATRSEGRQNMLCAYLSLGLLVGLGANAVLGWWWADPVTALAIAAVAVREGRDAWRGEDSCCTPAGLNAAGGDCGCEPGCGCCS
jgi:divalent metal cation (Fe/Co/Zn/Cd) transporter